MNAATPADGNLQGPKNRAGGPVRFDSTAAVTSCVEIDLRIEQTDPIRWLHCALDGIQPGDVVKILVDRTSPKFSFGYVAQNYVSMTGVRVQVVADSVSTRDEWTSLVRQAVGS